MVVSPKDVIRTSPYIPMDFDINETLEPNYEQFTNVVAMAVDSVERRKYGYEQFYKTIKTLINNHHIPYPTTPIEIDETEDIDYEGFAKSVAKIVFDNHIQNYEELFNKVNELIEHYGIERHVAPKPEIYGGRTLKKDW